MKEPNETKPFPIQGGDSYRTKDGMIYPEKTYIPWWLAEEAYKNYNCQDSQSLERIAERGGFGREELLMLLRGERK